LEKKLMNERELNKALSDEKILGLAWTFMQ
jgi:hypothetical protein